MRGRGESVARMVKSADTADLKSADHKRSWGFKSPSGHQKQFLLRSAGVRDGDEGGDAEHAGLAEAFAEGIGFEGVLEELGG